MIELSEKEERELYRALGTDDLMLYPAAERKEERYLITTSANSKLMVSFIPLRMMPSAESKATPVGMMHVTGAYGSKEGVSFAGIGTRPEIGSSINTSTDALLKQIDTITEVTQLD